MERRSLLATGLALAVSRPFVARAQARTRVTFWHAMTAANGEELIKITDAFNASQNEIEVQPLFRGEYAETLTAAIAAWRANQAPHLVQMFEVGTGSMLAAGAAVKQIWQLSEETGVKLDPEIYIPAVRGYYSLSDGRLASFPFNSSTAVMWYNKDAFEKAGLDPEHPPATWPEVMEATRTLRDKQATPIPMTTTWPTWIQMEQYGAIHNVPFATLANGFDGWGADLLINQPPFVKHLQRLMYMSAEGTFRYGGRDSAADPLFTSGQAAIGFNSSASRASIARSAQFRWAAAFLPYDPELIPQPINSVIGGASLWVMTARNRTPAEYRAVAEFLKFIARPEIDAQWSSGTGNVTVTQAGYDLLRKQGFFDANPGAEIPFTQLTRGEMTANSRGFRLGRMPELRNIIQEEMERALQGQQNAQAALDNAVNRGNRVLRQFERSVPS